jgi:arylsulfatase A-like enzyme
VTSLLAAADKPNFVIFLVDDMGVMDTSVPFLTDKSGNPVKYDLNKFYKTPAMEDLASKGLRFSTFYANSVCSPTRASIMTGQTAARHKTTQFIKPETKNTGGNGPKDWNWAGLTSQHVTLPRIMQKAGYKTIFSGKAHFAPEGKEGENPEVLGFDVNIAGCAYGQPGSYYGKKNFGHGIKGREKRAVPGLEKYHGKDIFLTEALTLEVKKEISKAVKDDQAFFTYMSHYAVHSPFEADPRFVENYKNSGKDSRAQAFASMIEGMDKSLHDIQAHLEKLGVAENTVIIFLGDNGTDAPLGAIHKIACSAPLRGKKGTHYEGGMHVPFIAAWAKPSTTSELQKKFPITQGIVTQDFADITDLMPTILEMADIKAPSNHTIDGYSLTSYFAKKEGARPQKFLMHFPHSHRSSYFTSYRQANFKLVYHYLAKNDDKYELFDLEKDPYEQNNLANSDKNTLQKMLTAMKNELTKADAQYPVSKDDKVLKPE